MFKPQKASSNQVELFLINSGFSYFQKIELLPVLVEQPSLFRLLEENTTHLLGKGCALSTTQITRITCQQNGYLNLNAFIKYYAQLREMGFEFSKILMILDWHEAHYIFPILHKWGPKLIKEEFNLKQIQFLFEMIAGEHQIEQLKPYLDDLIKLKIHKEHLQYILSIDLLDKTIDLYRKAVRLGFKTNEIYMMFNPDEKHAALGLILDYYSELTKYGFKNTDLISLAVQNDSIKIIETIINKFPKLIQDHFNADKLLPLLFSNNGIENLNMLHKLSEKLINLRFTRNEIINMAHHPNGAFRLQALSTRAPDLTLMKHTPIKILSMVIQEIDDPESELYQDDMTHYLKEINSQTESYFLSQLNLEFFSLFSSPKKLEEIYQDNNMVVDVASLNFGKL